MEGPVEAGTKVAIGFLDSLKKEPLSLALVVMNLALLIFFYFILSSLASQRRHDIELLYEDKKYVQELLSRCVVQDTKRTFLLPDVRAPFMPPNRIEF